ncbi:WecB/TagA/CpsF family glycosyltransferase [Caldalkalibacillus salinus]|uniref:WecB/TagA/CpsF family glycosyltransferase n=1 Tax=Caldalkalibacillus salinus TaxID=2803787 RepID=UPI0019224790|nr:WecB/TagA/CpsF family glycosyltransferase [Caldalkalibacillus salinus]
MTQQWKTVNVLGIPFSKMDMTETTQWITKRLHTLRTDMAHTHHIVTANPEIVMFTTRDAELKRIVQDADLVTPDGTGIVWAANHLGDPVPERVAGYDMLHQVCQTSQEKPFSVYILGANEEVNRKAAEKIRALYPQIDVVGRKNGYYHPDDEEAIVRQINAAKPDLLLVALGCPRQEQWIAKYKETLQAKVAIGVGGSLDVLAGEVKRAPVLWQKLRLEWLHRLLSQPSRWKRQLDLPRFVLKVRKAKNSEK